MRKSKNTLTVVRAIVVAGALFLPAARAATAYWQTTNGGTFNSPGNWDTGLPGPLDTVIFASNATYQVNWAASATNQSAYFSNGTVTCAIGNATWFLNKELVVGRGPGANGWLYHTNGTLIVTNTLGSGKISSGQGANHNYTMIGGNAIVDQLDFVDDGSAAYSKFLHFGTLTTLHGSSLSVGSDLVFFYSGGQTGIWNMLGGTNVVYTPTSVDLYTQLGWAYDSKYIINISGPSTVWSNNLNLYVGDTGSGNQVNLTNGARLESWSGLIGYWGLGNSVFVGSNSVWNNKGFLTVSVNGNGNRLTVTDGGRVNNTQGQIGSGGSGTSNMILVTGANTLWNNTTNLFIGGEGVTNQLTIADGGRVNCYGCYLGGALSTFSPGAQMGNSLWVTGSNSLLQASSLVRAGQFGGFSLLVITNGGTVNGNTGSVGGNSSSTNNTVVLTGPGSGWHSASTLTLGSTGGKNSILVANGAQLVNTRGI